MTRSEAQSKLVAAAKRVHADLVKWSLDAETDGAGAMIAAIKSMDAATPDQAPEPVAAMVVCADGGLCEQHDAGLFSSGRDEIPWSEVLESARDDAEIRDSDAPDQPAHYCRGGPHRVVVLGAHPAAPPSVQAPEPMAGWWVIHFEDAERKHETFTTEASARAAFEFHKQNWNCVLFRQVEASPAVNYGDPNHAAPASAPTKEPPRG